MNLKTKEEAFRFVMCEIWNEAMHLNQDLCASIHIACGHTAKTSGLFELKLRWKPKGDVFFKEHFTDPISLTQLCESDFSMTSWLRTFIHESKIQEDCPVRKGYAQEIAQQEEAGESKGSPNPNA